ncbi:hypothetical protein BSU04_43430 [Caballeronia sordidicola]|uniref:Uncharacterized protein n=1 Tax=Caballeronia sordidicola TaxID=196367 RepID=A0A226WMV6_CABSO|nr:hypothetical protein BSU04_43430 [Caballeronia sordidicola]
MWTAQNFESLSFPTEYPPNFVDEFPAKSPLSMFFIRN